MSNSKEYQAAWYQAHRTERLAYVATYRKAHPERRRKADAALDAIRKSTPFVFACPDCGWTGEIIGRRYCRKCALLSAKDYRQRNPEKVRASARRRTMRQLRKSHRAYNPKVAAIHAARRLAWVNAGDVTVAQLHDIFDRAHGQCEYCGQPVKAKFCVHQCKGFDHVVSRTCGGRHTASNMVLCCPPCNRKKANRTIPPEYMNPRSRVA